MNRPRPVRCYLLDIEGVLVRDKRYVPIAGSCAWLNELVARGVPFCLVSNNTTHRPEELLADLQAAGFHVDGERLVGALALGIETLQRWDKRRILWLGVHHLDDYWRENGFELVREGPTDAVILGANPELQLHDLELALPALMDHGAEIVALHRNLFYLDREGHRRLGPGAWCAALEEIVGRDRAVCIGKPSARIYRKALARLGAEPEETMFVSDDPVADLAQAKKLGMQTAFVLSGKYADHAVLGRMDQEEWPDIIADRLADLGGGQGG